MYPTCSFDETHVVLQTAHKLHKELHIKNVLIFDHSPAKNTQSLDLVSIKKERELHYIKNARFAPKSQHTSPFGPNEGSTVNLN